MVFRPELPGSDKTQQAMAKQAERSEQEDRHQLVIDTAWGRFCSEVAPERNRIVQTTLGRLAVDLPTYIEGCCATWTYTAQGYVEDTVVERQTKIRALAPDIPAEMQDELAAAALYVTHGKIPGKKLPANMLGVPSQKSGGWLSERHIPKTVLAHAFAQRLLEQATMVHAEAHDVPLVPNSKPILRYSTLVESESWRTDVMPEAIASKSIRELRKDAACSLLSPDDPRRHWTTHDTTRLSDAQFGDYLFEQCTGGTNGALEFVTLDKINETLQQSNVNAPQFV